MLTATQQFEVRMYLGYPAQDGSDSGVQRAFNTLPDGADVLIERELVNCRYYDEQIRKVPVLAKAITDGAIELRASYTLGTLQSLGAMAVGRIAKLLGVQADDHAFISAGPLPFSAD